jgi:hypothetical protein
VVRLSQKRIERPVIPDYYIGLSHFLFNWDLGSDDSFRYSRIEPPIMTKPLHLH